MARVAWHTTPFRLFPAILLCSLGASCSSDPPAAPQPGPDVVVEFPTASDRARKPNLSEDVAKIQRLLNEAQGVLSRVLELDAAMSEGGKTVQLAASARPGACAACS